METSIERITRERDVTKGRNIPFAKTEGIGGYEITDMPSAKSFELRE